MVRHLRQRSSSATVRRSLQTSPQYPMTAASSRGSYNAYHMQAREARDLKAIEGLSLPRGRCVTLPNLCGDGERGKNGRAGVCSCIYARGRGCVTPRHHISDFPTSTSELDRRCSYRSRTKCFLGEAWDVLGCWFWLRRHLVQYRGRLGHPRTSR